MKKTIAFVTVTLILITITTKIQAQEIKSMSSWGVNFIPDRTSFAWTKEYGLGDIPLTLGTRTVGYYNSDIKLISLLFGPTANYHFSKHISGIDQDKIDLYAGATVGGHLMFLIDESTYNSRTTDAFRFKTVPFLQIGGRYFFSDRIGIYAQGNIDLGNRLETGFGSSFEAGITFKRK